MGKRVIILGGGPIGIEAAALATQLGFEAAVLERGATGAHVARWGHVRFFSPWKLNRSTWGESVLTEAGVELGDEEAFPTGNEYLNNYLYPLAKHADVKVLNLTSVTAVTRRGTIKGELIGKRETAGPFLVRAVGPDGPQTFEADVVLDATGVYGQPLEFGQDGLPAIGQDRFEDRIERWIPDLADRDHDIYANQRVLLVGSGHSASTSLRGLADLRERAPGTTTTWAMRADGPPYTVLEDDPLPERDALARFGNLVADGEVGGFTVKRAQVVSLAPSEDDAIEVTFDDDSSVVVDRIISNVGYRPNPDITRELQIHHCYASEGPMKLAASLLAQSGGGGDCLAQESAGLDTLRNPEADFWVVGNKSYGRNSNFLLRIGLEQVETILNQTPR